MDKMIKNKVKVTIKNIEIAIMMDLRVDVNSFRHPFYQSTSCYTPDKLKFHNNWNWAIAAYKCAKQHVNDEGMPCEIVFAHTIMRTALTQASLSSLHNSIYQIACYVNKNKKEVQHG